MKENQRIDKSYIEAFNLGYEVARELDLKTPMFRNENPSITLNSPMQAGMFQFVQDKQAVLDKTIGSSNKVLKKRSIKKTFGINRNRGKGLTP